MSSPAGGGLAPAGRRRAKAVRGRRPRTGQVLVKIRWNWPVTARPLLVRTVVPALPAAVSVLVINSLTELDPEGLGDNGIVVAPATIFFLVLLIPLAFSGGYLVVTGLVRAVAAVRSSDRPGSDIGIGDGWAGEVRMGRLWAGYVAGLAILLVVAAVVPKLFAGTTELDAHLRPGVPAELSCATAPGFLLCCAGPLVLLCPVLLMLINRGRRSFSLRDAARQAAAVLVCCA